MDTRKRILVNSVIGFLQDELSGSSLSEEKKESLEVAVQCLETAFEVESQSTAEKVNLLSLISVESNEEITEEQKLQAEVHKTKGNNFMKSSEYKAAVDEYSKALALNPKNAVYYCNRAAAYTRLMKDLEAINDCKEAIRIDPTYGKAYGRLGIAYSNLNKYDLALQAYETALKYDPTNTMYETNLKVAQERLQSNPDGALPSLDPRQLPDNLSQFMNNPNIINMASQILSDQNFHSMMSGLINNMSGSGGEGMPAAVQTMLQAGQALAQRVVTEDPDFYNRVSRNVPNTQSTEGNTNTATSSPDSSEQKSERKNEKSS